jgi:hypothetical protein
MDPTFLSRSSTLARRNVEGSESSSSDSVRDLRGFNPAPTNAPGGAPEIGVGEINKNLANILGEGKKANHIHDVLESAGLSGAFDSRCQNQPDDLKKLAKLLHFDKSDTIGGSQGGRLAVRSAVTLAFARGADVERLSELRFYCEYNLLHDRGNIVAKLATDPGNVNSFIDGLYKTTDYQIAYFKASGLY